MSRLATAHEAINLSQGFPDFPAPEEIKQAAIRAIQEDDNQYSDDWGTPALRAAVAEELQRHVGLAMDPSSEVTVTCGSTEAMVVAMRALCEAGDEVVLFEPSYENHRSAICLAGAVPRAVRLRPGSWALDEAELDAAFGERTRAVLINSPHNPTGKVFLVEELRVIAELCERWDVVAVSDEIYRHLVYNGRTHRSIATLPGMRERTVVLDGLSKSYGVTGWRVGWALARPALSAVMRELHTQLTLGAPTPFQAAGVAALGMSDEYYDGLRARYVRARDLLSAGLNSLGFRHERPHGAFYIMAEFPGRPGEDDVSFCRRLIEEVGVAGVPGGSFFERPERGAGLIRFSFSKSDQQLQEALSRMDRLKR
jgi:aspartate/methionine/tyrosine aminotransferase